MREYSLVPDTRELAGRAYLRQTLLEEPVIGQKTDPSHAGVELYVGNGLALAELLPVSYRRGREPLSSLRLVHRESYLLLYTAGEIALIGKAENQYGSRDPLIPKRKGFLRGGHRKAPHQVLDRRSHMRSTMAVAVRLHHRETFRLAAVSFQMLLLRPHIFTDSVQIYLRPYSGPYTHTSTSPRAPIISLASIYLLPSLEAATAPAISCAYTPAQAAVYASAP